MRMLYGGYRNCGLAAAHQARQVAFTAGISAEQVVIAQFPEVARLGQGCSAAPCRIDGVSGVGRVFLKVCRKLIDLGRDEPCDRDI